MASLPSRATLRLGTSFCGAGAGDNDFGELDLFPQNTVIGQNLAAAQRVAQSLFMELEAKCRQERDQYKRAGQTPSLCKRNRWSTYLDPERRRNCAMSSLEFIRDYPEGRVRVLSEAHLRFLIKLQHLVAEDAEDFYRPEGERRHGDTFEGILTTAGVNSQLIKDAHRSEWSIEGKSFLMQDNDGTCGHRKEHIKAFQQDLVTALETFLMGFCRRRCLSDMGTERLLQVVTTQMSQCGLANLDQSSTAAKFFVSGRGLDQRITYNLSCMETDGLGEALQLSLLCMKTGFSQYHLEEEFAAGAADDGQASQVGPRHCEPSSYLYQYATLRFIPNPSANGCERTVCTVVDALDEVRIDPAGL